MHTLLEIIIENQVQQATDKGKLAAMLGRKASSPLGIVEPPKSAQKP